MELEAVLRREAGAFGVELTEAGAAKLVRLLMMVREANERIRLTAVTDWEEALAKHLLDSLAPLALGLFPLGVDAAADLGSGGGFPGLVLAIVLPSVSFTLIEATGKKATFLAEAARSLGLANVRVLAARAEEIGHGEGREGFGVVTARAVAELPVLLELAHPLLRPGGRLLAWKGPEGPREIEAAASALAILGAAILSAAPYDLPGGLGHRLLLAIEKTGPTPAGFPRRPGMARKRPL